MHEHIGSRPARRLLIALGTTALLLTPGTATGAVTENVDQTISIPGETPSGYLSVDDQTIEVAGVKDVTIRLQAVGSLGDPVVTGPSGGANCTRMDRQLQLQLAAGATGSATVTYKTVAAADGAETTQSELIPFGGGQSGASPVISLCFR